MATDFLILICCLASPVFSRGINERIIGGSDADITNYRHQVSLRVFDGHTCGAALISNTRAVTSAHCVGGPTSAYSILAGTSDRTVTNCATCALRSLQTINVHPDFINNPDSGYPNDLAVLIFGSIASNSNIGFVSMAQVSDGDYTGSSCVITGWGLTQAGNSDLPTTLQMAPMTADSNEYCTSIWGAGRINQGHICAVSPDSTTSVCNSDTGGPLICGGKLVGISSWQSSDCSPSYDSVYSRVSYFYSWLSAQ